MIRLIVALGNPGSRYALTRHNIAWQVLDNLSFYSQLKWHTKFRGKLSSKEIEGEEIFFLKPKTYMNRSGESLLPMMNYLNLEADDILVIHDELELNFGTIGFKEGGGLGGHNGLRSIAFSLETRDFNRMRLGISRPPHRDITSYVLGDFADQEKNLLPQYLVGAAEYLEQVFVKSFRSLVTEYRKVELLKYLET